jgi:hypothetical protein
MQEVIKKENIIIEWLVWHFLEMPKFLFLVWKNYIMFAVNYFSLPLLLKTLISPWRRNAWIFPKVFDIQEYANVIVSNIFSRVIGFILRIILIIVGAIFQVLVLIIGILAILFWILIPFILIFGIVLIFNY